MLLCSSLKKEGPGRAISSNYCGKCDVAASVIVKSTSPEHKSNTRGVSSRDRGSEDVLNGSNGDVVLEGFEDHAARFVIHPTRVQASKR